MAEQESGTPAPASDIRPVVRTAFAGNMGLWLFMGALAIAGVMLFSALRASRSEVEVPVTDSGTSKEGTISALPPLELPASLADDGSAGATLPPGALAPALAPAFPPAGGIQSSMPPRVVTRIVPQPASGFGMPSGNGAGTPAGAGASGFASGIPGQPGLAQPAIVYDRSVPPPLAQAAGAAGAAGDKKDGEERVLATRLANPAVTVPKGTVIPAVLESALDSTRAGAVRAVVTRDVMGFDGTHVLIPRGSKLYGEYDADLNYGQNRALIRWTRLTRPDAVIMNLDSPAADPLGRAGLKGKVNSHFWARFGGAILQSVLDVGVGIATRSASGNDSLVVALPGSVQNMRTAVTENQGQVRPTLRIKQGTSVSVFVARDLDFSTVEK